MSESNANSVERRPQTPTATPPRGGGLWIALIAVFGLVVVGLNVMLFLLLQGHQRALDARTNTLQQRENAVAAQEANSLQLRGLINALEKQKKIAQHGAEAARTQALDADQILADRNRAFEELNEAQKQKFQAEVNRDAAKAEKFELDRSIIEFKEKKRQGEIDVTSLKGRISSLQKDEDGAKQRKSEANQEARDAEFELNRLNAELPDLRRQRDSISKARDRILSELAQLKARVAGYKEEEKVAKKARDIADNDAKRYVERAKEARRQLVEAEDDKLVV